MKADPSALLAEVVDGGALNAESAARLFDAIMAGQIHEPALAALLTAMAVRGPTVEEIAGAATAMRAAMTTIAAPDGAVDLCGTGGDGQGTLNISTAVSFVVAACGVPVAKHGNRNMSSKTGAADVLEALGVKIDLSPAAAEACLQEAGLCFLFAQTYHPAMKHVAPVRKALGIRTIFNLLGPLSNPARVRRQLIGVYARDLVEPLAQVLGALGAEKAWVVHGNDGLDEITTTDITHVAILDAGNVTTRVIEPEDAGLARATLASLKGGSAGVNAAAVRRLFDGKQGPYRDIVLLNAAAALIVAGKADDLRAGADLAAKAVDGGGAKRALESLVAVSNRSVP
ncbi:MAG: anthranilate phosphoribosyltransferase [Alphaproteobacteria bacterium]|nr:anthranilate phosphoribosyltransferase [Alphaproteobacteria bacterium]MDE2112580.1 anthranilate phosphoribosyltransferase [Alphaproteobacteria bacterium]MDE2493155.1 anthranilate phosphoribosyltransferase [Alphaproteobacteria bacterium]